MSLDKPIPSVSEVSKACRIAISQQIHLFREDQFRCTDDIYCPFLPHILLSRQNAQVHHDGLSSCEFRVLVSEFLKTCAGMQCRLTIRRGEFEDPSVALQFSAFHRRNAHLRLVSKQANLSVLKRGKVVRSCDDCHGSCPLQYLKGFRTWLCSCCLWKKHCGLKCALALYQLRPANLCSVPHALVPNSVCGGSNSDFMKVFRKVDVKQVFDQVHGSVSATSDLYEATQRTGGAIKRRREQSPHHPMVTRSTDRKHQIIRFTWN